MKLERKWARIVLAGLVIGIVCLLLSWVLPHDLLGHDRFQTVAVCKNFLSSAGVVFPILALVNWYRHLRCPNCGKTLVMPWWRSRKYLCAQCGEPFVFDDEVDEP